MNRSRALLVGSIGLAVVTVVGGAVVASLPHPTLVSSPTVSASASDSSAPDGSATGLSFDTQVSGTTPEGVTLTVSMSVSDPQVQIGEVDPGTGKVQVTVTGDVVSSVTNTSGRDFKPAMGDSLDAYYAYPGTGTVCSNFTDVDGTAVWLNRDNTFCLVAGPIAMPNSASAVMVVGPGETSPQVVSPGATLIRVRVPEYDAQTWSSELGNPVEAVASLSVGTAQLLGSADNECPGLRVVPLNSPSNTCKELLS